MKIIELTKENIIGYASLINEDHAMNIERSPYRGLILLEGNTSYAYIIWNVKKQEDTIESQIDFFHAQDVESAGALLEAYTRVTRKERVKRSFFALPRATSKIEAEALRAAGFSLKESESDQIIVRLSDLLQLPIMKVRKVPETIFPIGCLTFRAFQKGIKKCVQKGRMGLCEDLNELSKDWFENDISCCSLKDGEINGFLLLHQMPSGMLTVQLMVCLDKDYGSVLPGLMRQCVTAMEEKYPPEIEIMMDRHNEATINLTKQLFPNANGMPVFAGEREEYVR